MYWLPVYDVYVAMAVKNSTLQLVTSWFLFPLIDYFVLNITAFSLPFVFQHLMV